MQQQEIRRKIARIEKMEAQYAVIKEKADRVDAIDNAVVALKPQDCSSRLERIAFNPYKAFKSIRMSCSSVRRRCS